MITPTPTQTPQQNPDDAKFQALLAQHSYKPSVASAPTGGWYDKLTAPAAPTKTNPSYAFGKPAEDVPSFGDQVGEAFKAGQDKTNAAAEKFHSDKDIGNKAEDILHATAGAASQITAPIAPLFKPLSEIIDAAGKGYATLKPVQDFAASKAGDVTKRVAGDVADTANIINTVAGAKGLVDAAPAVLEKAQKFGQATDAAFKSGVDTIKTKAAEADTARVHSDIVDNYYKAIKPTVGGKTTLGEKAAYDKNVVSGVQSIIGNKGELKFTGKDGEEVAGRTPHSPMEMAQAIDQTKASVFNQYDALTKKAGEAGAQIDTSPIAKALDKVTNSEALQISHPEAINYAKTMQDRFGVTNEAGDITGFKKLTPEVTQELIKNYNSSLEAFYRNPSYDNASKAAIDAGIVQNLREQIGKTIENATGEDYTALKKQYGALSAIEKDVNKRATVLARQQGGGLADYAQVFSGGDMVHGILSLNPALFAKGAAQSALTKIFQHLKSPDRAIQNMFKAAEGGPSAATKIIDSVESNPQVGLSTRGTFEPPQEITSKLNSQDKTLMTKYIDSVRLKGADAPDLTKAEEADLDKLNELLKINPDKSASTIAKYYEDVIGKIKEPQPRTDTGQYDKKKVDNIPKELQPLAEEARKYKSAEEFIASQKPIYHGTTETFSRFSDKKGFGGTAWFSDNKEAVAGNKVEATKPPGSKWNVMERYINPEVKLVDRNTAEGKKLDDSMMKDQLRSMGYGGIKHEADADRGTYIELFNPSKDAWTKSQLTDFYNKVTKQVSDSKSK